MVRYDADCVMKNIFEIFDSMNTGKINQNEILWVFSMGMNGTGTQYYYFHDFFQPLNLFLSVSTIYYNILPNIPFFQFNKNYSGFSSFMTRYYNTDKVTVDIHVSTAYA